MSAPAEDTAVLTEPNQAAPDAKEAGPLRRTLGVMRPHFGGRRALLGAGCLALVFEVILRVLEPWPVKIVVDAVTRSLGADLASDGPKASLSLLGAAALATISLVGMRALCNYLATLAFAIGGSRIATALRQRVFDHVTRLSAGYHSHNRSADTVQRLVGDVGKLQEVAVTAGLPLVVNVFTLIAMTGVMIWLDPLLALAVVVAALLFLLISRGSTGKITVASRRTRRSEGALANVAQEAISAIPVVHAYSLETQVSRAFGGSNDKALKESVQARRLAAGLERSTDVIVGLATAAILFLGGWRVMNQVMTPGDLVLFLTYLKTAMKPLRDIAKYTGRISRASASGERIADLLDVEPEITSPADPVSPKRIVGHVRFRGLVAGHPGRPAVLHGIDLDVPAGQKVALVGPSGAGKSTLTSLIPRLADPWEGSVTLDGHDLRELDLARVRSEVTTVLQESILFTGTIADNIRHGRPEASDAEVVDAARRAQAHDFVMRFPQGYDTPVGERGSTLSGGQRQRIAIARAVLRGGSVVVLDEATTGLDPENVQAVESGLSELTRGRTTFVITHDLDTARRCDRIVWIENGVVRLDVPADAPLPSGAELGHEETTAAASGTAEQPPSLSSAWAQAERSELPTDRIPVVQR
ncbi:ABC transporter ATP-binding protein [Dermacoccaceae bacterium W4C1]